MSSSPGKFQITEEISHGKCIRYKEMSTFITIKAPAHTLSPRLDAGHPESGCLAQSEPEREHQVRKTRELHSADAPDTPPPDRGESL